MHHDCLSSGSRITLVDIQVNKGELYFAWALILVGQKPERMTITDVDSEISYQILIPANWQTNKDIISAYEGTVKYESQEKKITADQSND
jgi:hypothetical protein